MRISDYTLETIIKSATKMYGHCGDFDIALSIIKENYPFVLRCPEFDMEAASVEDAVEACLAL
ncbi:MAG: hypothetical protein II841_04730 [Bacteroidales bacterium]|nr:hypothetical protein [Bacteroidales bacterium]